jgi:hypothetical protein
MEKTKVIDIYLDVIMEEPGINKSKMQRNK